MTDLAAKWEPLKEELESLTPDQQSEMQQITNKIDAVLDGK